MRQLIRASTARSAAVSTTTARRECLFRLRSLQHLHCLVFAQQAVAPRRTKPGTMPEWCYETSTTMYQPQDGGDEWNVIIARHISVKGRGHLARPGAWLDPVRTWVFFLSDQSSRDRFSGAGGQGGWRLGSGRSAGF